MAGKKGPKNLTRQEKLERTAKELAAFRDSPNPRGVTQADVDAAAKRERDTQARKDQAIEDARRRNRP